MSLDPPPPPIVRVMGSVIVIMFLIIVVQAVAFIFGRPIWKCVCEAPEIVFEDKQRNIMPARENIDRGEVGDVLLKAGIIDGYGIISGYSMNPSLFSGYTVLLRDVGVNEKFWEGEVLRYTIESRPGCEVNDSDLMTFDKGVLHRVVGVYDDYLVMRGDNNGGSEFINRCQVTGKVIGVLYTREVEG